MSHRSEYETQRSTLEERRASGNLDDRTADAIEQLCDALDPEVDDEPVPEGEDPRAVKTLDMYTRRLRLIAERFDGTLTDTTASTLNEEMQRWYDGSHPAVDDNGVTENTISNYQGPLRVFYRFHEYGIDPTDIEITTPERSTIDPEDMLSDDELGKIRTHIDSARLRMVFEFLLNTGIRNRAARTIRVADVRLQEGVFHLNEDVEGLKQAAARGTKRPLLGAEPAVRRWLNEHPAPGEQGAYLITNRPDSPHLDPTSPVSHTHLGKLLEDLKTSVGIDKPLHPHALRHNFVTRAKRDYEMDDATIKYLIGHPPESTVMERTYQHISSETHVMDAEASVASEETRERRGLTPKRCTGCDAALGASSGVCDVCGTVYAPDIAVDSRQTLTGGSPESVARALLSDDDLKQRLVTELREQLADDGEP